MKRSAGADRELSRLRPPATVLLQFACKGHMEERPLQLVQRGQFLLVEASKALGLFPTSVEFGSNYPLLRNGRYWNGNALHDLLPDAPISPKSVPAGTTSL